MCKRAPVEFGKASSRPTRRPRERGRDGADAPRVAQLLLDLADRLKVGRAVEGVAPHEEELDEVPSHVATGDVEALGEVRERKALVDGDDVRHTVARVDDDARLEACASEREVGVGSVGVRAVAAGMRESGTHPGRKA